jgi:hypothetical protein
MAKFSTIVQLILVVWFVWWMSLFLWSRWTLCTAGLKEYDDLMRDSKNFCDACEEKRLIARTGEYSERCPEACEKLHETYSSMEICINKVVKNTFLCGYVPCEEVLAEFSWKFCLMVIVWVYAGALTAKVMTGGLNAKAEDNRPCWAVKLIQTLVGYGTNVVKGVMATLDTDEVNKYKFQ